jgi:hypothetical protein
MWIDPTRSELAGDKKHECTVVVPLHSSCGSTDKRRYCPFDWHCGHSVVCRWRQCFSIGDCSEHEEVCARFGFQSFHCQKRSVHEPLAQSEPRDSYGLYCTAIQREHVLGAAGPTTNKFRCTPLDVRGEEVIGEEEAVGVGPSGMDGTKSVMQTRGVWSGWPCRDG